MDEPKLNFLHICEYAHVSDGKLSIIDVFDNIWSAKEPITNPKFFIVTNVTYKDRRSFNLSVKIFHPITENEIAGTSKEITKDNESGSHNLISMFINTSFPNWGRYKIKVFIDNNELDGNYYLNISPNNR